MQVGKIGLGAQRALDRVDIVLELDQVTRHEARRESHAPQQLDQQPATVTARAKLARQRLVGGLHPGFHPHRIFDKPRNLGVYPDDIVDRRLTLWLQALEQRSQPRSIIVDRQIGRQILRQLLGISERQRRCIRLDEKIERVDHHHLGGHVDRNAELGRRLGKDDARQPIAVRVLLPVDEMGRRRHFHRITRDACPRVRRRPQADYMGTQNDRFGIAIRGDMIEGGNNRQGNLPTFARIRLTLAQSYQTATTSSANTVKPFSHTGPKVVVSAVSVASRPRAIRILPIRGWLWRASKTCQAPPR